MDSFLCLAATTGLEKNSSILEPAGRIWIVGGSVSVSCVVGRRLGFWLAVDALVAALASLARFFSCRGDRRLISLLLGFEALRWLAK